MLKIATYINSLQFVVICIICIQVTLIIDTATLLNSSFPAQMSETAKAIASTAGAITLECFMLLISVNTHLFTSKTKLIPVFMGVSSTVMTLFFLETFTSTDVHVASKRIFVSLLFGFINYMLGELFTKKWNEFKNSQINSHNTEVELKQAQHELNQAHSELSQAQYKLSYSTETINDLLEQIDRATHQQTALEKQLTQAEQELEVMKTKLSRKKVNT